MTNTIHTFETCANCNRQHSAQILICAGCAFELPRKDLSALADGDLTAMVGRCLEFVNGPHRPDTIVRRRAVGLLVIGDREMQARRVGARDEGHSALKPSLYAFAAGP